MMMKYLTTLLVASLLPINASAAEEGKPKAKFDLDQVVKAVVREMGGPARIAGSEEDVLNMIQQYKLDDDRLASLALDSVEPVREPIFISTDPSSALSEILVTKTRPTTIAFMDSEGQPFEISSIGNVTASIPTLQRFTASKVGASTHIVEFSTTVLDGWTTMDLHFKEIPYPIPVRIQAGSKYHAGSQAIVINDSVDNIVDSYGFQKTEEEPEKNKPITNITRVLTTLANYGARPSGSRGETEFFNKMDNELTVGADSAKRIKLEYMSLDQFKRPKVEIYQATVAGKEYYLVRTNGQMLKPDFTASVPASTIGNRIWAYAIPYEALSNILTIQYGGGNHVYAIERTRPTYAHR